MERKKNTKKKKVIVSQNYCEYWYDRKGNNRDMLG